MKQSRLGPFRASALFFRRVLPSVGASLAVFVLLLGNRSYAGRIPGAESLALAALGAALPLEIFTAALAIFVGRGKAEKARSLLAQGKKEEAERQLGSGFGLLILLSLLLMAVFLLLGEDLLRLFGAGPESLPFARGYINALSPGLVFFMLSLGLYAFFPVQERQREAGLILALSALVKLILDPVFILVFDLGLGGAALASCGAFALSAVLMTAALAQKNAPSRLRIFCLRPGKDWGDGLSRGLLALLVLLGEGLVWALLNRRIFRATGEMGPAVLTVLAGLLALFVFPLIGLAKGTRPLIRDSFLQGKIKKVRRLTALLIGLSFGFSLLLWAALQLWSRDFFRLFGAGEEMISLGTPLLRVFFAGAFLMGLQTSLRQALSAVGAERNLPAAVPPRSRLLMLIFILIFSGNSGRASRTALIMLAQPAADLIAACFALILFFRYFHQALAQGPVFGERRQGRLFRFLRLVLTVFTPQMETIWEEPFAGVPSVFVCNHDRAFGPIAMCVHFPLCRELRPWINAQVLSVRETPQYVRDDYWWNKDKWTAKLYDKSLAYLAALALPMILRGADSVPVYHDTGVMATLRDSIKTLSDGKHLLLFPEQPTGYRQYDTKISDGFVSVGRLYYKRSRERVHFYPAFVDWKGKKIHVGKPLVYDPSLDYVRQAKQTAAAIEDFFAARTEETKKPPAARASGAVR